MFLARSPRFKQPYAPATSLSIKHLFYGLSYLHYEYHHLALSLSSGARSGRNSAADRGTRTGFRSDVPSMGRRFTNVFGVPSDSVCCGTKRHLVGILALGLHRFRLEHRRRTNRCSVGFLAPNHLGLTTLNYAVSGTIIGHAKVEFNSDKLGEFHFDYNSPCPWHLYDLGSVAIHESGHAAGLDHTGNSSDWPYPLSVNSVVVDEPQP